MYTQTQGDLEESLKEQYNFLQQSSQSYDNGSISEAKRLALHTRILVHDTSSSKSLLSQLNVKDKMDFLDTSGNITKKESVATCNFVLLQYELFSGQSEILPCLENHVEKQNLPFNDWWEKTIYYDPNTNNYLTRKLLILTVANKDGGAHIDSHIDNKTYVDLTKNNAFGWKATINGNAINTSKALYAMVRQVAFEVISSLDNSSVSGKLK